MTEGRAEVEILGQRITVRGRGTPEYIRDLAQYLDGKIRAVRDQAQVHEPTRLSVLAGLHVVDELFRSREREAGRVPGDSIGRGWGRFRLRRATFRLTEGGPGVSNWSEFPALCVM